MTTCERAYESSGRPEVGLLAVRALYGLGDLERLRAWTQRLRGTPEEAEVWYRVATLHRRRGELDAARAAHATELELFEAAGNHRGAARSLYGAFFVAWSASRYLEALELARRSFEHARLARDVAFQAEFLQGVFTVLYDVGDLGAAERVLAEVRRLVGSEPARQPPELAARLRAELAANEAALLLEQGRPALARERGELALRLAAQQAFREAGEQAQERFVRSVRLNLVQASLALGEPERAERDLALAREQTETSTSAALWLVRGELDLALGRPAAADAAASSALAQQPVADAAWRLWTLRGRAQAAAGDLAAAEVSWRSAIDVVEQMRRELSLDELKAQLLDAKREPYDALVRSLAGRGAVLETLEMIERARSRTFLDAFIRAARSDSAPQQGEWSRAAGERLETLGALLPAMGSSPGVEPRPAGEVLAALADRWVLIAYEAGEELWLLGLLRGEVRLHRVAASTEAVAALVDRWMAAPDAREPAETLGGLLLPAALLPPRGVVLDLVPDGVLARLPWAALLRGGRRLVEDHPVAYSPSAGVLAALRHRPCGGLAAGEALVLADPRSDLPAALAEGRAVGELTGARVASGAAADLAALMAGARAPLLHVASHAGLGPRGAWLALADGELGARKVLDAGLAPRLVVLASCASAVPQGESFWGSLGGAFLAAGSTAVLATLGSVEDAPTRRLVEDFYRAGGATDPVGALARSQRAWIAAGEPVGRWAPFVILGSDLPLCPNTHQGE